MENRIIKIFLASPMDLMNERILFRTLIEQINSTLGSTLKLQYKIVSWETDVVPDKGIDAQDVVNHQIAMEYDIFVCVFGNRIGTVTNRSKSGTVEEYERALIYKNANPDIRIMCYFISADPYDVSDDIKSLKQTMNDDGVLYSELTPDCLFEEWRRHFESILIKETEKFNENSAKQQNAISTAVALIDANNRLLLVKRSRKLTVGAGLWQIPGGKAQPDEKPEDCAVREIAEELCVELDASRLKRIHIFLTPNLGKSKSVQKTLKFYLFTVNIDTDNHLEIKLNDENEAYEWIDLRTFYKSRKNFFGIHQKMVETLWRELGLTNIIQQIVKQMEAEDTVFLPDGMNQISNENLWTVYSLFSLLGIVSVSDGIQLTSEYSLQIMDTLVELSRAGIPLLENDAKKQSLPLGLRQRDIALLQNHRKNALCSHESFLSFMSSKVDLANSVRNVCDLLIFGEADGKKYILLRWDLFAKKYQLICSGVPFDESVPFIKKTEYVLSKRLGSTASHFFDYMFVKTFRTSHFSAGSVNRDPILRKYNVDVVVAFARKDMIDSIKRLISASNETIESYLCFLDELSMNEIKKLNCFIWCELDELLKTSETYKGKAVQGMTELFENIGSDVIVRLTKNALPIEKTQLEQQESFLAVIENI